MVDSSDLPEALRVQLQAIEAARRRKRAVGAGSEITEEQGDDEMEADEFFAVLNGKGTAVDGAVVEQTLPPSSEAIDVNGAPHCLSIQEIL